MPDDDIDDRNYRTELLGPGINDNRWALYIDGREIAATGPDLGNEHAKSWAHHQLGEGVSFVPALQQHAAERAIAEGRNIDWLASPDRPQREPGD